MAKNYFDIHCEQDKVKAKEFIDKIDVSANIRLFIDRKENIRTLQQLKFFHKIVKEFTEFMTYSDYSQNTEGDWKAMIKKRAHFYKSNTGITFLEQDLKQTLNDLLLQGVKDKKITQQQLKQIYLCFREQSLKSLSEASSKEVNSLISEAMLLCLDTFKALIDFKLIPSVNVLKENLIVNHKTLYDLIVKWKEGFINQDVAIIDNKQQEVYNKINEFF